MNAIRLEQVTKLYGATRVLSNLSFDVATCERLVVLGPSGSGKTTLLRVIAGLEIPASGNVWIHGQDVTRLSANRRGVSMVFQDYAVYPQLTVAENLSASLGNRRQSAGEQQECITESLAWFRISSLANRKPSQLSGGQLQRVALAKALINRPNILLLDEPFSQLDTDLREEFRELLLRLHAQLPMTVILVTHDALDALRLGQRVAVLDQGELLEIGETRDVYAGPRHRITASMLSPLGLNWLQLQDDKLPTSCILSDCLTSKLADGHTAIAFRPESVRILRNNSDFTDTGLKMTGQLTGSQSIGFAQLARVQVGDCSVRALVDRQYQMAEGKVELCVVANDLLWFK